MHRCSYNVVSILLLPAIKCVWKFLFTFFGFPYDLPPDGAITSQKRFENIFHHHGFSLPETNVFVAVYRQFDLLCDALCDYAYCS